MNERVSADYVTLDVFTDRAFGGNPLAVVLNAAHLTEAEMQAVTAEFNYSETTFVLPPADAGHTARVRIFTACYELPFAGHPNIGTAFVIAGLGTLFGRPVGDSLLFEEKAGLIPVAILKEGEAVIGARLTAPKPLVRGRAVAPGVVAQCVGIDVDEVATDEHPPVIASVGLPFLLARVRSRAVLAKCRPSAEGFARHLPLDGATAVHVSVRDGATDYARVFANHGAIIEDAATGSANLALVALHADLMPERDAELRLDIVQGVEMGRPSRLAASAIKQAGKVQRAEIAGRCVPVMRGSLSFARGGG